MCVLFEYCRLESFTIVIVVSASAAADLLLAELIYVAVVCFFLFLFSSLCSLHMHFFLVTRLPHAYFILVYLLSRVVSFFVVFVEKKKYEKNPYSLSCINAFIRM